MRGAHRALFLKSKFPRFVLDSSRSYANCFFKNYLIVILYFRVQGNLPTTIAWLQARFVGIQWLDLTWNRQYATSAEVEMERAKQQSDLSGRAAHLGRVTHGSLSRCRPAYSPRRNVASTGQHFCRDTSRVAGRGSRDQQLAQGCWHWSRRGDALCRLLKAG